MGGSVLHQLKAKLSVSTTRQVVYQTQGTPSLERYSKRFKHLALPSTPQESKYVPPVVVGAETTTHADVLVRLFTQVWPMPFGYI